MIFKYNVIDSFIIKKYLDECNFKKFEGNVRGETTKIYYNEDLKICLTYDTLCFNNCYYESIVANIKKNNRFFYFPNKIINLKYIPNKIKNAVYDSFYDYLKVVCEYLIERGEKQKNKVLIKKKNIENASVIEFFGVYESLDKIMTDNNFKTVQKYNLKNTFKNSYKNKEKLITISSNNTGTATVTLKGIPGSVLEDFIKTTIPLLKSSVLE